MLKRQEAQAAAVRKLLIVQIQVSSVYFKQLEMPKKFQYLNKFNNL